MLTLVYDFELEFSYNIHLREIGNSAIFLFSISLTLYCMNYFPLSEKIETCTDDLKHV